MAVSAPIVRADALADARRAIEAGYGKMFSAISKADVKAYAAVHSADYYETDKKGRKQTLAEITKTMSGVLQFIQNLKYKVTVQSVKMNGKNATVAATEIVEGTLMNPQTQKKSTMRSERTLTDTWVQSGGKWLRKSSKELSDKTTVDGKPQP